MLTAEYYDGRSTRVLEVGLQGDGERLLLRGDGLERAIPWREVRVYERLGRAPRKLRFGDGSFCSVKDLAALDALLALGGHRDGWVDRMQRHWQFVLMSLAGCAALAFAGYEWMLPWAAAAAAARVPPAVGHELTRQSLAVLDGQWLFPSKLAPARRRALADRFHDLRLPGGGNPGTEVLFRRSPLLGANAFTLPDGTMVVLDDLVTVIDDDRQVLAAMAHEEGHAHGHHGLQLLLQSSVVGAVLALYIGDLSSLLAVAPAALMQAHYSQTLELAADDYAATLLTFNGLSPRLLAGALGKLSATREGTPAPGYLSTHPATAERIRRLNERSR